MALRIVQFLQSVQSGKFAKCQCRSSGNLAMGGWGGLLSVIGNICQCYPAQQSHIVNRVAVLLRLLHCLIAHASASTFARVCAEVVISKPVKSVADLWQLSDKILWASERSLSSTKLVADVLKHVLIKIQQNSRSLISTKSCGLHLVFAQPAKGWGVRLVADKSDSEMDTRHTHAHQHHRRGMNLYIVK